MNSISDYIELSFTDIKNSETLSKYKSNLISEMRLRANQLQSRGVTDQKVIYDLIVDEYPDPKSDYLQSQKKGDNKKEIRSAASRALAFAAIYTLTLTVGYLVYSFASDNWAKSWLIMVGGIFSMIIFAFSMVIKNTLSKHEYKTARAFTAASVTLFSVFIFLCSQILLQIGKSYLIIIAAAALMITADAALALVTKQKFAVFNLLLGLPAVSALIYVTLALSGAVSWHPYWLIILNAVIVDLIIITVALMRNSKKYEAEEIDNL